MIQEHSTSVRERVEQALSTCRPYLQKDGGDVTLMSISNDGIVELKFEGTCIICPVSRMTLRAGLERSIMKNAPEIKRVEQVK
jgi:Fe-S cluster biogenesis protein NfuA